MQQAAVLGVYTDVPHHPLRLFLFTPDPTAALEAQEAGVFSAIVDWEDQGKHDRQAGHDTEVNLDTVEDLKRVAQAVAMPVTVRVNGGPRAADELEVALDHGARILMLPMAKSAAEVERFVNRVAGRAETLIQIETQALVDDVASLSSIGWDHAFVGLNDLMISRAAHWLWEPLLDGTMDAIYAALPGRQVGFGGVTVVGGGHPLRFTALLQEMARLGCGLSFLRRTFRREILGRNVAAELRAVRSAWEAAQLRSPAAVAADHEAFLATLRALRPPQLLPLQSNPLAT